MRSGVVNEMLVARLVRLGSTGESGLLRLDARGVLSVLSFTNSCAVRYFDQAWLRKATDIVEGGRGNVK